MPTQLNRQFRTLDGKSIKATKLQRIEFDSSIISGSTSVWTWELISRRIVKKRSLFEDIPAFETPSSLTLISLHPPCRGPVHGYRYRRITKPKEPLENGHSKPFLHFLNKMPPVEKMFFLEKKEIDRFVYWLSDYIRVKYVFAP